MSWCETLDEASVPLAGAFEVRAGGTARGIGGVSVAGNRVTLTLTSAVAVGEAVTLSYLVPAGPNASPLRDTAMNNAAGLSDREVRNDTTAVAIVSDPGTDTTYMFRYGIGVSGGSQDVIELTVTFSERVTVTGVPGLALQVGTVTKQAAYAGGSGTTALTFRYTTSLFFTGNGGDTLGLAIDCETATAHWHGERIDYDHALMVTMASWDSGDTRPEAGGGGLESVVREGSSGSRTARVMPRADAIMVLEARRGER